MYVGRPNYANVAYDFLPYNMKSAILTTASNIKCRHCRLVYTAVRIRYADVVSLSCNY